MRITVFVAAIDYLDQIPFYYCIGKRPMPQALVTHIHTHTHTHTHTNTTHTHKHTHTLTHTHTQTHTHTHKHILYVSCKTMSS